VTASGVSGAGPDHPVRTERNGPVTTVILSRPDVRNAVDRPTADALAAAFRQFDADPDAAVAVLWGEGGTFCAGADLKAMTTSNANRVVDVDRSDPSNPAADGPMGPTRLRLSKPVIAAVSGYAVAGGFELALWCDLRVVEEDATFGVLCRRWGVPLIDGGTVRLPRLIGTSRAMDLILTGRPVDAAEAERIGLANRVVPRGSARSAAEELAARLAGLPQTCLRHDRLSVLEQEGVDEVNAMGTELAHGRKVLAGAEIAAGVAAFRSGAGRHGGEAPAAPTPLTPAAAPAAPTSATSGPPAVPACTP
jgi:enoyl-CoA hydratase